MNGKKAAFIVIILIVSLFLSSCNLFIELFDGGNDRKEVADQPPAIHVSQGSVPILNGSTGFNIGLSEQGRQKDVVFTISNGGDVKLIITSELTLSNTNGFTISPPDSYIIPGKGYKTFTINFTPTVLVEYTTDITIQSNDENSNPFTFGIIGKGVEEPRPEINVYYGSKRIVNGESGVTLREVNTGGKGVFNFHIRNAGNAELELPSNPPVSIEGNEEVFNISINPESHVDPGKETTFQIEFTPLAESTYDTTIHIDNNDTTPEDFSFTVTASGKSIISDI
jgi:hypothetical protein